MKLAPGNRLGPYEVVAPLGAGGMGEVYRAHDTKLKRDVAIKVLPESLAKDAEALARFEREALAVASLSHPSIVAIHDFGCSDGIVYAVMELLEGETLRARLKAGPIPLRQTITIALQIAAGLAATHKKGIVHRDLKPENVFITQTGHVKILDFGLARHRCTAGDGDSSAPTEDQLTEPGAVMGTVGYMSPEQAKGRMVDHRSDIFSFGTVLYELLTGVTAFRRDSAAETLAAILKEEPKPLPACTPPQVKTLIERCLAKDPAQRYQHIGELAAVLETLPSDITTASGLAGKGLRPRWSRALAIGTVLVGLLVVSLYYGRDAVRRLRIAIAGSSPLHVAVLPFSNISNEAADRNFCDGLTEILASTLTQLERFQGALWVVPASEVRTREVRSAEEARKVFGVNLVFSGGFQRDGDGIRLAVNLVDAASLRQVRSKVIRGSRAELASLEDWVTDAMVEMLDLQLAPAQRKEVTAGGTKVAAAYELYVQGRGALGSYQGAGDSQKAARLFREAIALDPRFALAHAGLASASLEMFFWRKDPSMVEQATASAKRALEQGARLAEVHAVLGEIGKTTGRYDESIREFQRALELDPRSIKALGGMAKAYDALGRTADAEATYRRAIALKPGEWLTHGGLAAFYLRHGRYEEAEKEYQKVIDLVPENSWGYSNLATVYYTLGRYADARRMFERAVEIRPSATVYSNLGTLAFIQRDWAEAAKRFEQACALNSSDYVPLGNLGIAYRWIGGHEQKSHECLSKAIALAERQLSVNPKDTSINADLAGYHAVLGEKDAALDYLRQVEAEGRGSPDLAIQIAYVYTDLNQSDQAIAWIGTALDLGFPIAQLSNLPALEGLLKDPRVQKLLKGHETQGQKPAK